jgi:hypothetical protein
MVLRLRPKHRAAQAHKQKGNQSFHNVIGLFEDKDRKNIRRAIARTQTAFRLINKLLRNYNIPLKSYENHGIIAEK